MAASDGRRLHLRLGQISAASTFGIPSQSSAPLHLLPGGRSLQDLTLGSVLCVCGRRAAKTALVSGSGPSGAARTAPEPQERRGGSITVKCIRWQGAVYGSKGGKSNFKINLKSNGGAAGGVGDAAVMRSCVLVTVTSGAAADVEVASGAQNHIIIISSQSQAFSRLRNDQKAAVYLD